MGAIQFISGQAALRDYINGIDQDAKDGLDRRNITATGGLKNSHRTEVVTDGDSTKAALYANDYWKRAGSGSPPGTVANIDKLKEWLLAKNLVRGVENPSWLAERIQDKIYLEGSRDFRERNPNEYRETIKRNVSKVPDVLKAFLRDVSAPMDKAFTATFKVA